MDQLLFLPHTHVNWRSYESVRHLLSTLVYDRVDSYTCRLLLIYFPVVDSYTRQYGFPSGPGESSHIREDVVEPAQTEDFTSLALGREHRDVVSPHRYIPGVVSCLFHNLVNINDKKF
jgi:hypothetical protein